MSATVSTRGGTARAGHDFASTRTRVTFANRETSARFVEIPIHEDHAAESPEKFTVSLSHPQCGALGAKRKAAVTIFDDPAPPPPPPPPPAFTIGGTVDGLRGSGLVLSNLGAEVPVSANGSFTFPETASAGQGYEVAVKTQPSNPTQVCSVQTRDRSDRQRERDRHRGALCDARDPVGAGFHVRGRRPGIDAGGW